MHNRRWAVCGGRAAVGHHEAKPAGAGRVPHHEDADTCTRILSDGYSEFDFPRF